MAYSLREGISTWPYTVYDYTTISSSPEIEQYPLPIIKSPFIGLFEIHSVLFSIFPTIFLEIMTLFLSQSQHHKFKIIGSLLLASIATSAKKESSLLLWKSLFPVSNTMCELRSGRVWLRVLLLGIFINAKKSYTALLPSSPTLLKITAPFFFCLQCNLTSHLSTKHNSIERCVYITWNTIKHDEVFLKSFANEWLWYSQSTLCSPAG